MPANFADELCGLLPRLSCVRTIFCHRLNRKSNFPQARISPVWVGTTSVTAVFHSGRVTPPRHDHPDIAQNHFAPRHVCVPNFRGAGPARWSSGHSYAAECGRDYSTGPARSRFPTGRDKISASPRFREAMLRLGETNQWKLGPRKYNADDHCVGQTYVELWQRYHDDKMIQPRKLSGFDDIIAPPRELAKVEWPNETRDCVKTHFSTIQSAWTLRQSSPYRKFDRYRISLRHFSHSLANC